MTTFFGQQIFANKMVAFLKIGPPCEKVNISFEKIKYY